MLTILLSNEMARAQEGNFQKIPMERGLGAHIGNAYSQNWQFNYGGTASVDFLLAKYYSIGSALILEALTLTPVYRDEAARVNKRRIFSAVVMVEHTLLLPLETSSGTFVPFAKLAAGAGRNRRNSAQSIAAKSTLSPGIKYFFAHNLDSRAIRIEFPGAGQSYPE